MSLIIKGMDMPKYESEEVFIIIKSNGEVRDNHGILLTNAQAIEIPTPHGRLIDFTKLEFEDVAFDKVTINAPTVIESED